GVADDDHPPLGAERRGRGGAEGPIDDRRALRRRPGVGLTVAAGGLGPGRQRELLQGQAGIVGADQFGDQRFGGVGPEAGVVAEDEVDGRDGAHPAPPPASAWASRSRSVRRTTRTVPATSWTRTIRQPRLTP